MLLREADGVTTGCGIIVMGLYRLVNGALEGELQDDGGNKTQNPGDEDWAKRDNDVKRRDDTLATTDGPV